MKICSVTDCERARHARGYCSTHYNRWRLGKSIESPVGQRFTTAEKSFEMRTKWEGDCLVWTAATVHGGYGVLWDNGVLIRAHRYAWEREHGPIPDGLVLDHTCYKPLCCNVGHLRLATRAQNNANKTGPTSRNRSGYRNVYRHRDKWIVWVKSQYCGVYDTVEEAAQVASRKREEIFGEYAGKG